MRVDEVVDDRLVRRIDVLELHAHSDAAIAPRDAALGVDVALAPGHPEAHLDLRALLQRARRPDRDAAVAEVQRQGGGDRIGRELRERKHREGASAPQT